jgi:hypothetical protein
MYIVIARTYRTLLFDIVSTTVEAPVLHQCLYPFLVERFRLRYKARGNGFFSLVVVIEPPTNKEGFKGVGTNEKHLALSLGCMGDDRIVPSEMLRDIALRRQCVGGRCRESSLRPG